MKLSVLIPAYNASKTIESTLNSVLGQSRQPAEIIVMDDGSTDGTLSILRSYEPRIKVYHQENKGASAARNLLCQVARGETIAFLDSDDIWHPKYLETQEKLIENNPWAVASFTGCVSFHGFGEYKWNDNPAEADVAEEQIKRIEPVHFFKLYNEMSGLFLPSYCCVPKRVIEDVGLEPFHPNLKIGYDLHFFLLLALRGSFVCIPNRLVAYRIGTSSLSFDRVPSLRDLVMAFELIQYDYEKNASPELLSAYRTVLASKMRYYAKILVGIGERSEARKVLIRSIATCSDPLSISKSCFLLGAMNFPRTFKRYWNPRYPVITSN